MNKLLLSVLGVAAAALLVWALMPADQTPVDGPNVAPAPARNTPEAAETPEGATGGEDAPAAAPGAKPRAAATPGARPAANPAAPQPTADRGRRLERPQLLPPLMPLPEGEMKPPDQARWGRKGAGELPTIDPTSFRDSVRRYYGNLPRTGRMPGRINVEEVFPPALYEALNVPPDSQLVELGHHPASSPEGFAEILEAPDGPGIVGVTVVTPDGERIRDYVRLEEPAETP